MQKRADARKFHFIYKTTCKVSGRWYIGVHSTDNLNDGYIGSGTMLWHSINKHGKENHICEILEMFSDRKSAVAREAEIVTEDLVNDDICMNLIKGGTSEGCLNGALNGLSKAGKAGGKAAQERVRNDPKLNAEFKARASDRFKKMHEGGKFKYDNFRGKKHSEETKAKMRATKKERNFAVGENNSQFGTCWIFSESENKAVKIKKEELQSYLDLGWRRGRK